jgi:dynein heavy chain
VLGICRADKEKVHSENIGRLFAYEAKRVFMDRLVGSDRELVDRWIKDIGKRWGKNVKDVYWTDILTSGASSLSHSYEEVADIEKVNIAASAALTNYNMISNKPMDLVLFNFALEHLLIILRIIKQPKGNALLVGVGGSGRQSMTRLACYICDFEPC